MWRKILNRMKLEKCEDGKNNVRKEIELILYKKKIDEIYIQWVK